MDRMLKNGSSEVSWMGATNVTMSRRALLTYRHCRAPIAVREYTFDYEF